MSELQPKPTEEKQYEQEAAQAERRLHVWLGCMLLTLIVFQLNYLAFRHYERSDWTSDERFTLSERTVEELQALEQDVELILFLGESEELFPDVDELLQRYRSHSTRLHVRHVDPDREPTEARALAAQYGVAVGIGQAGENLAEVAMVIVSGDRTWKISRENLVAPATAEGETVIDVTTERALTGGIVQVLSGESTTICFASGRGELAPTGERAAYVMRQELERENMNIEDLPAVGLSEVPDSCNAVFVLGPQRAYAEAEAQALIDYVRTGGNVLLALDPVLERDAVAPTGFEGPLADFGILLDPSIVFEMDFSNVLGQSPADLFRVSVEEHPLTDAVRRRGGGVAVSGSRSVRIEEGSSAVALLTTSEQGFAELDIAGLTMDADLSAGPEDVAGPVSVAVAKESATVGEEPGARAGRIVVIGDLQWLDPGLLMEPQLANFDLMMSSVGWLTQRDALISIPPRTSAASSMSMSQEDVSSVALRLFVVLPLLILLLGAYVYWTRRQ